MPLSTKNNKSKEDIAGLPPQDLMEVHKSGRDAQELEELILYASTEDLRFSIFKTQKETLNPISQLQNILPSFAVTIHQI